MSDLRVSGQSRGDGRKKRRPADQTRGPFEDIKAGWHACPFMSLRRWLDRDEICGECYVEDDSE
jgi:hypothetical protein